MKIKKNQVKRKRSNLNLSYFFLKKIEFINLFAFEYFHKLVGLNKKEFFIELCIFQKHVPIQTRGRARVLDIKDRLVMFLLWMRQNCSFYLLSLMTGLSERTCRDSCYEILEIMFNYCKK
jgi:hypothetical protein